MSKVKIIALSDESAAVLIAALNADPCDALVKAAQTFRRLTESRQARIKKESNE